jgi:hypothetical protein
MRKLTESERLQMHKELLDEYERTSANSHCKSSTGSVEIGNVKFDTDHGELTIDHVKCPMSDIYTIPLDKIPKLIKYLQSISQNK